MENDVEKPRPPERPAVARTDYTDEYREQQYRLPERRAMRAHDVRHLTQCAECGGLADKRAAINDTGEWLHPACLYRRAGLPGMLALVPLSRAKVCMSDMPASDMRVFINHSNE